MRTLKFFIGFLFILLLPIAFVFIDRTQHKDEITIATGGTDGGYYAHAQKYKTLLAKEGIELKIVTTYGSLDAQIKLLKGEVDFAFVQGGTEILGKDILALANVAYEPVWVFYSDSNISSLVDLTGAKIDVGVKSSGIYPVAKKLLSAVGIDSNSSEFVHLKNSDASFALQAKDIDAMFYIASANSKLVKKLLNNSDIHLMDFKDADAYKQYFLNKNQNFQILKLAASGFDLKNSIPKSEHTLLSKTTLLVTLNESDDMTRLFMKVIDKVHSKAGIFHKEHTFPNASMMAFEQHEASVEYFKEKEHFYEKFFNFWTAQSLSSLHTFGLLVLLPILTIFAFFVEVIVPTLSWYERRKIIKWYAKINELDTGIENFTLDEAKSKKDILEKMLCEVRNQDDIPSTHMEEFYTLQNQIINIIVELQKRIDGVIKP